MRYLSFSFFLFIALSVSTAQPKPVPKNISTPILMHYMPWFETPEHNGRWGWHWKMNTMNPDSLLPSGNRQIASHYYPLIGPYASKDEDVIEYHLLLMKYSGIDGIIIDWYGVSGSNGDIGSLLDNSNAAISKIEDVGLSFSVMLEDRFSRNVEDVQQNIAYIIENYIDRPSYFHLDSVNQPLLTTFGPITFESEALWDSILSSSSTDFEFLQLWYQSRDVGMNSDGEFAWIYEIDSLDDYAVRLERFNSTRAATLKTAMSVAYCGFNDFYFEGGAGNGLFTIPHDSGHVLATTLSIFEQNKTNVDLLQLATWNDFGEGTMFEPTEEFRFSFLDTLQKTLGVPFDTVALSQIYRLYKLRKFYKNDTIKQNSLDSVFNHFVCLLPDSARALMDRIDGLVTAVETGYDADMCAYPSPSKDMITVTINSKESKRISISVVDGLGNDKQSEEIHIISPGNNTFRLDLSQCSPGVIYIVLTDNEHRSVTPIIRQ